MSSPPEGRIVRWTEWLLLLAASAAFCFHSLPRAWKTLNTDFPNYYLAAQLARQGDETSRMYEWTWIERQKDLHAIDVRVLGLLPITPVSTLVIWPLTSLKPLAAKHVWILLNLGFLLWIGRLLCALTSLSYKRVALVLLFSFPLYRNLLYGQFYILLLLILLLACDSYRRGRNAAAGGLLALAAAFKVFPLLLFLFFLKRRNWTALAAGLAAGGLLLALSLLVFGVNAHLVWFQQILPWVARGEGLGTYAASGSIASSLHRLFLSEPQWNPHPWRDSILTYSLLASAVPVLVFAPAVLLLRRGQRCDQHVMLEWSALITGSLAISTLPASYNFVLIVFPVCVLAAGLLREGRYAWLAGLSLVYLGIGFPFPAPTTEPRGFSLFLYTPRLPLMLALLCGIYARLWQKMPWHWFRADWSNYAWTAGMLASIGFSIPATFVQQTGERREYRYRSPIKGQDYLNGGAQAVPNETLFYCFTRSGYRLMHSGASVSPPFPVPGPETDVLSFAVHGDQIAEELLGEGHAQLRVISPSSAIAIPHARNPGFSHDGRDLVYVREERGRGRLVLRSMFRTRADEVALTPGNLDVYEASFLSPRSYAFAAAEGGNPPAITLNDSEHPAGHLSIENGRYPALSPDGLWLAYSHLEGGVWNLWLRSEVTGAVTRIGNVPCNEIEPAWKSDSRTLLYSTDCGRSIWFTALAERTVVLTP